MPKKKVSLKLKYFDLCNSLWKNPHPQKPYLDIIMNDLRSKRIIISEDDEKALRVQLGKYFIPKYKEKWLKSGRQKNLFITKHNDFLNNVVEFNLQEKNNSTMTQKVVSPQMGENPIQDISNTPKAGRPRSSFEKGCLKTKNKMAKELASSHTKEELSLALKFKAQETESDNNETNVDIASPDYTNKVLTMFMDLELSKRKYEKLRAHTIDIHGHKLYPPYSTIANAMRACYPDNITITDQGAKVHIFSLLEHTIKRILMTVEESKLKNSSTNLNFLAKWGMDGASGQQTTRQTWNFTDRDSSIDQFSSDDDSEKSSMNNKNANANLSDASVFISSLVPLRLKTNNNEILWKNDKPSSIFYTRPISFKFVKESKEVIEKQYKEISELMTKVQNYIFEFKGIQFNVTFDLKCSMIDGKTCHVLAKEDASSNCNICGVSPKNANKIDYVLQLRCKTEVYKWGLSILHCWIRMMEYCLHIGYNSDFKKSQARGENKETKRERKKFIQESLKKNCNLTVDVVKQGAGTTNTGNVARSFFEKRKDISKIIGVDENLLTRFYVILQLISCTQEIKIDEFEKYCRETARICSKLYSWYYMPPSIHKLLIHGCDIMREFKEPMGFFSEEPQETNNKTFRKARAAHSRMCSRSETNEDIMHYTLILSDPIISSLRKSEEKKNRDLIPEAAIFLK